MATYQQFGGPMFQGALGAGGASPLPEGAYTRAALANYQGQLNAESEAAMAAQKPALEFQRRQWEQSQLNRDQLLGILGLKQYGQQPGGLLGSPFFSSVLGNTLPDVVGGVTGAIPGLGGAIGGGGGGAGGAPTSLFGQQIAGRGQLGQAIMGLLGGFGGSERARIAQNQQTMQNTALARLDARGLGSSNLAGAEIERAQRFGGQERAALEDRLIGQQVGALSAIGEGLFGDVGKELDRQTTTRGQTMSLLSNLLGSALDLK